MGAVRMRVLVLVAAALASRGARAEDGGGALRVGVMVLPPAVMDAGDGTLTGFSVDLWNEVAARLGRRHAVRVYPDAGSVYGALRAGEADVAAVGSFYSVARDREFDFTFPVLDAGLQVMVRGAAEEREESPLATFLRIVASRSMLSWLVAAIALAVIPGHLLWLLARGEDGIADRRYFPGIFQAVEWAIEGILGLPMSMPRPRLASVIAHLWVFAGVVFVAFFTAQMTANITVDRIHGRINGPGDLRGKLVGTLAGSDAVETVRKAGARVQGYARVEELLDALLARKVEAVVTGAPVLRYLATHQGEGRVRVVGPEFDRNQAAFVVRLGSPLRKQVNGAILAIREDGTYGRIHARWFGAD